MYSNQFFWYWFWIKTSCSWICFLWRLSWKSYLFRRTKKNSRRYDKWL